MAVAVIPYWSMAQDERRCSNSGSGGGGGAGIGTAVRSCKKLKQKKIPQRGLGVAQLERIRLEELQKKDAAAAVAASPCFVLPLPHHPPSLADLPPPNSVFKTSVPISTHDLFNPPPIPPFACEGGTSGSARGQGIFPLAWNGLDFNHDADKAARKLDHGFQFHSHLHDELLPLWQSSPALQRNQQQQSPFPVNASPSPSPSSGVNIQMEPPSNQSYCSNPMPPRSGEERMVGMKRPWPFSMDDPLNGIAPFHCKLPPSALVHERGDESSCGWRDPPKFNSGNSTFRDGLSTSIDRLNYPGGSRQSGSLDGEFLTLGPSVDTSNLKYKQPMSAAISHCERLDITSLPGTTEDMFLRPSVPGQQQGFYSFLPSNSGEDAKPLNEWRSEGHDCIVDLNLKL